VVEIGAVQEPLIKHQRVAGVEVRPDDGCLDGHLLDQVERDRMRCELPVDRQDLRDPQGDHLKAGGR
jgi:hypothetical protein